MTERGLPIVDGAPACPFVAFDDDRDERAASPDHRHRCYAEPQPAPRALAHQEAYCLSSAFPVCPTFQDWARREAARSRLDAPPPPDMDSVAAAATARQPQRNPPRNWAAPPPWLSRGERRPEAWEDEEEEGLEELGGAAGAGAAGAAGPGGAATGPRQPGRGLSGSFADRIASDAPPSVESFEDEDREDDENDEADEDWADADAAAPEPAAGVTRESAAPPPAPPAAASSAPRSVTPSRDDWDDGDDLSEPSPRRRRERDFDRAAATAGGGSSGGSGRGSGGGGGRGGGRGGGGRGRDSGGEPPSERRRDSRAPEWERARPLEAYPTLRSRRLSELSIPPLLVAVVALALAAAVLFALPGLLGFGNPSSGGGGSASPTVPVVTPFVSAAPTPVPKPTDQLYTVQQGDTMSKIADRFEIPLGDLIAANAETIPDPNKLQIGDQVIIPAKQPSELPASSEIPAAT